MLQNNKEFCLDWRSRRTILKSVLSMHADKFCVLTAIQSMHPDRLRCCFVATQSMPADRLECCLQLAEKALAAANLHAQEARANANPLQHPLVKEYFGRR